MGLISHFPRDYEDRSRIKTIAETEDGETVSVRGMVAGDVRGIQDPPGPGYFKGSRGGWAECPGADLF